MFGKLLDNDQRLIVFHRLAVLEQNRRHGTVLVRHQSYLSPVARGVICGLGAQGYRLALDAVAAQLNKG